MSARTPEESHQPHWFVLTGLLIGLLLGIGYAWWISPVVYRDASPALLGVADQETYRRMVALAFDANHDVGRAAARLALLGGSDSAAPLDDLSGRIRAADGDPQQAAALAALAEALRVTPAAPEDTPQVNAFAPEATTAPPRATATISNPIRTATPVLSTDQAVTSTTRPTRPLVQPPSATPTLTAPFALIESTPGCDPNAVPGLLEVLAEDAGGAGVSGQRVRITWEGGEEIFFTGLAPEISPGYADYLMRAGVVYSVRIGDLGEAAMNVTAPTCSATDGSSYLGGVRLRFRQK